MKWPWGDALTIKRRSEEVDAVRAPSEQRFDLGAIMTTTIRGGGIEGPRKLIEYHASRRIIPPESEMETENTTHGVKRNMEIYEALKVALIVNADGSCSYERGVSDQNVADGMRFICARDTVAYVRRALFGKLVKLPAAIEATDMERLAALEKEVAAIRAVVERLIGMPIRG